MRLVTYDRRGRRRLGAIAGNRIVDLAGMVGHPAFPSTMEALVARPRGTVLDVARTALERTDQLAGWTVRSPRLLAPILPPSLAESEHGWLAGPGNEVPVPGKNGEVRFDLEVAAVIYRPGKPKLKPSDAGECIFGYTLMHSWFTDDSFSATLGPCIVTADEFDPDAEVVGRVGGRKWSVGKLGDAEVSFERQIVQAARTEELLPGEIFGSGTLGRARPAGKPPRSGTSIEIEHPSIGNLTSRVGPRSQAAGVG